MTTRDIQEQLQDLYGVEVSHALISNVTEAVDAERKAWQNRTLDEINISHCFSRCFSGESTP